MDWNRKINFKKGESGFKKSENKFDAQILLLLSQEQKNIIESFCKKNKLTKSDMIRTAIYEHIKSKGFNPDIKPKEDKRQLKLYPKMKGKSQ